MKFSRYIRVIRVSAQLFFKLYKRRSRDQVSYAHEVHFRVLSTLVEMRGFEPLTPCLQGRCSPN